MSKLSKILAMTFLVDTIFFTGVVGTIVDINKYNKERLENFINIYPNYEYSIAKTYYEQERSFFDEIATKKARNYTLDIIRKYDKSYGKMEDKTHFLNPEKN